MSEMERSFDWDEEISNDSEFTILEEGDYDFEILKFERGRSKGSERTPSSPMAILSIKISNGANSTVITDYLTLHSKMEWRLSQFFRSIGQKKAGEAYRMNWSSVPGAKGRCKVKIEKYTTDKGEERESNKIEKYYDYTAPAPAITSMPHHSWKPGEF